MSTDSLLRNAMLVVVGALTFATIGSHANAQGHSPAREEVRPEWGSYFERYGVEGAFVVYDRNERIFVRYAPERANHRFIPASTYKIFNSLVALETGVVDGVETVVPWDSVPHQFSHWNRDHDMRSAFRYSVVWYYQELARRIGPDRMRAFVERENYGNEDIGGEIDQFWLTGDIRISPNEQIDLLRKLYNDELGFSRATMQSVKDIMVIARTSEYALLGKTGWSYLDEGRSQVGWFVGWVERDCNVYFFALNLETSDPDFPMGRARQKIAYEILREMDVLPAGAVNRGS